MQLSSYGTNPFWQVKDHYASNAIAWIDFLQEGTARWVSVK